MQETKDDETLLCILPLASRSEDIPMLALEERITSNEQDMAPAPAKEGITTQLTGDSSHCTYPSFVKTLRIFNMHPPRKVRLEVPATFVKEHGDKFQATVVLQGPNGRLQAVRLSVHSSALQDRVHLGGSGWRDFILQNGFKVDHQLRFSLVAKSTFVVRLSGDADVNIQESVNELVEKLKICRDKYRAITTESNAASGRLVGVQCRRANDEAHRHRPVPESSVSIAFADRSFTNVPMHPHGTNDVVYARDTLGWKRNVDKLVEKFQCPHFVTLMKKSNLRDFKTSALGVPAEFFIRYGTYFAEVINILQGPTGRLVEVRFSSTSTNLRFTTGWDDFRRENDIKLGDVLLFSLYKPACWLVQLVLRQPEDIHMGDEC